MTVYLIADVKLIDDAWVPSYAEKVHNIVHKHGGRYLARSANVTSIEGAKPDTTVIGIIQFPTIDAVHAFTGDPDYAPFSAARQAGSVSRLFVVDDTDVAGTIDYLQLLPQSK